MPLQLRKLESIGLLGFKGVKSACPEGLAFGARLAPNDLIAVTPQTLGFPIGEYEQQTFIRQSEVKD
jgi:hypothetical protein